MRRKCEEALTRRGMSADRFKTKKKRTSKVALIVYHERLGDIIQCFPAAENLARDGFKVYLECRPEYHDIFECVDYVHPVAPNSYRGRYDVVFDLQIWPLKYDKYRASGQTWREFVYFQHRETGPWHRPRFTHLPRPRDLMVLPDRFSLVSPHGYSQVTRYDPADVVALAERTFGEPCLVLNPNPQGGQLFVPQLRFLPWVIAHARQFMTINSAPAIIADVVRNSYHHIAEPAFNGQDDYQSDKRINVG